MSFTKTLLAGAALCALCTAPALARTAPPIHLAGIETPLKMKPGAPGHYKTNGVHPDVPSFTETITFSGSLSKSSFKGVPVMLWGETWFDFSTCMEPTKEKGVFPKSSPAAKIASATSTGTVSGCGSTIYTFYGPLYTLKDKKAKSDSFAGDITAKKFVGYNLDLHAITNLSITK
jgi:opacity protein-like surface antigen